MIKVNNCSGIICLATDYTDAVHKNTDEGDAKDMQASKIRLWISRSVTDSNLCIICINLCIKDDFI